MKKTSLISLSSYCPQAKAWSVQDLIKEAVNKEDQINHVYQIPEYPKMTTPIPTWKKKSYGLFRSIERWGMWA